MISLYDFRRSLEEEFRKRQVWYGVKCWFGGMAFGILFIIIFAIILKQIWEKG
jgi:hypothetical protein